MTMKLTTTPGEFRQASRDRLAKQILNEKYVKLEVNNDFDIKESFQDNTTKICCEVRLSGSKDSSSLFIESGGQGPVDAFFSGLSRQLSERFCSLNALKFSEFGVDANFAGIGFSLSGSDAPVEATLVVSNSQGSQFVFRDSSRSMNKAAISVVLKAIEHFINLEEAVVILHDAIIDAEKRNRGDLFNRYAMQLAELVEKTSYVGSIRRNAKKLNLDYSPWDYED